MRNHRILIGTSGWHYDHWKGPFYPKDLSAQAMLDFYARRFITVEINNSFYQLPTPETLHQWQEKTPQEFVFAFKASRYITHMKKLKDPQASVQKMIAVAERLGSKLGPILFQLPPRWRVNPERLKHFLHALPDGHRYTFEFRDPSWFDDRIYNILAAHNAAFCQYQIQGRRSPKQVTADFVYIRLHGPAKQAYEGKYDTRTLSGWAGALSAWQRQGKTVFCYFDNDQAGYAAQNALRLRKMLGEDS